MNDINKDEDILPLSPEEIKAIGSIGIGPSKQDIFLNQHYRKLILAGIIAALAASLAIAYFTHCNDRAAKAGAQVVTALKANTLAVAHPAADYDAKALELIRTEYGDTAAAPTARLLEALSLLSGREEQAKAGLAELEALANNASAAPLLRSRALCAMATYAMEKGDDTTATTHWNTLLTLGESPYSALAYMSLGDISKTAGKVDEARQHYQQAMTSCQTSQLVLDPSVIATRLMLLDVDAPRPVSPAQESKAEAPNPFASPLDATPAPTTPTGDGLFSGGSTLQQEMPAPTPTHSPDLYN